MESALTQYQEALLVLLYETGALSAVQCAAILGCHLLEWDQRHQEILACCRDQAREFLPEGITLL